MIQRLTSTTVPSVNTEAVFEFIEHYEARFTPTSPERIARAFQIPLARTYVLLWQLRKAGHIEWRSIGDEDRIRPTYPPITRWPNIGEYRNNDTSTLSP